MIYFRNIFTIQNMRVLYGLILISFVTLIYLFKYLLIDPNRAFFLDSLVFGYPISMMIMISTAYSIILYQLGKQMKKLLRFQFTTTGIVGFFSVTFLMNLILAFCRVSSPMVECATLYASVALLLSMRIWDIKGLKAKIIVSISIVFSFFAISTIPDYMTVNRFPIGLAPFVDEQHFWYPMSVKYFEEGLLNTIISNTDRNYGGYGLFVHHVWVTIKRLVIPESPESFYYFSPKLLFIFGLGFIAEIKVPKTVILFSMVVYLFCAHADAWLRFLLFSGLYSEGITTLFFAVILKEVLYNSGTHAPKDGTPETSKHPALWMIAGLLNILKPFVSYMCFLLPLFYANIKLKNWIEWLSGSVLRLLPMLAIPVLWTIINMINDVTVFHTQYGISNFIDELTLNPRVDLTVLSDIVKHWAQHKMTMAFYILSIAGAIVGITPHNRRPIAVSLFFVGLNFVLIYCLYAALWAAVEKESAFRYLSATFHLCFFAFVLGLSKVYEDTRNYAKIAYEKITRSNHH